MAALANQTNPEIRRGDLTEEQWEKLKTLLPPQKAKTGRPGHNHRQIINGILWILRTGAPWRDLPDCYGVHSTVSSRFYRWRKAGIWDGIWQKLQTIADERRKNRLGSSYGRQYSSSSAPTRSRCKGGQENQALGRSVGGFSTKIHIRAEGFGKPMVFALTSGERHDTIGFENLLKGGRVKRMGRGRPKSQFKYFLGDKGYSSQAKARKTT